MWGEAFSLYLRSEDDEDDDDDDVFYASLARLCTTGRDEYNTSRDFISLSSPKKNLPCRHV